MNKRILAVVATIVFAIAGVTALLLHASKAEERAFDGAEMVEVLRVAKDVAAGASAADVEGAVERVELPAAAVPDGAMASLDGVADQVTVVALVPGDLLVPAKFGEPGGAKKGDLPEGLQMISVQVVAAPGVAGRLAQGDLSGVIANYSEPEGGRSGFIAEQVLVLDVDKSATAAEAETAAYLVTLAVDGPTAVKISNAASFGTLWLTEQNEQTKTPTPGTVESKDVFG
jgi:pilus assembly protein CpaB